MRSKQTNYDDIIADALLRMLKQLDRLEAATAMLTEQHMARLNGVVQASAHSKEQAVLLQKLERLTLKRHAVLTATLGGQSYQAIAKVMGCDLTTVKLHLKGALGVLGFRNRSTLLATAPNLLGFIGDAEYALRYGISKRWWLEQTPEMMSVLRATKPAKNQHTQPKLS